MNPRISLQVSLLLAFALCLALVMLFQLLARAFIELPELYAQEYASDVHAVTQVKRAFALNLAHLQAVTVDTAHWRGAYDFMATEKGGAAYSRFVDDEYRHTETMHVVPRVNGYTYFQTDGQVFFESSYDLETDEPGPTLPLSLAELRAVLPPDDYGALAGGFVDSPLGPLQVVIAGISDDATTLEPRGYLVIWRKFDELFLREFVQPLGADIQFAALQPADELSATLLADPQRVLPRDEHGRTHWLIRDIRGMPLLTVSQATRPRTFNDGLFSTSSVVGFSTSALLLALLSLFVARSVIRPIVDASSFIEAVTYSRDYSRRLAIGRRDEVGIVAQRFNHLLERVELQEEALRLHNAQLEELADKDPLTGVHNRRVFERMLERDWSLALRSGGELTCIMLDVDCFKSYNDCYGHPAGDAVLQQVANLLKGHIHRASDCLCRYGGEEFVILLMNTEPDAALQMTRRMVEDVEALAIPHARSSCASVVTLCAGVATVAPRQSLTPDSLVQQADQALYRAKHSGRNQVVGHIA